MRFPISQIWLFAPFLAITMVACSGGSKPDSTGPQKTAVDVATVPATIVSVNPTSTAPPANASIPTQVVSSEQKDAWVKKIDQATTLLTGLSAPGVLRTKLDKGKYLAVKDLSTIDLIQDELTGRLLLEELLGKSPDLGQYRGDPGSNPPPEGGYLAAIKAALNSGQLLTVGGTSSKDPVRVLGADRLIQSAIFALQGYLPADRYQRLMPTEANRIKFDTKTTQLGVIDIQGWSDAYFLLVEIQRAIESQTAAK